MNTGDTTMPTDWEKLEANRERIENECLDDILTYELTRLGAVANRSVGTDKNYLEDLT